MRRPIRPVLALVPIVALLASGAVVSAKHLATGAVKGATYRGVVRGQTISLKVAGNGKTATASLAIPPAYCPSGGAGGITQRTHPGAIATGGAFKAKIAYTSTLTHKQFATVTVKGTFFAKAFQGSAKTAFSAHGARSCDGQTSFQATTKK
jgi:hypothetical protein